MIDIFATSSVSGKVVCVGRNYAEHAKELNNPVPTKPLIFMKPATSLVSLHEPVSVPTDRGPCHFETEIALLIGETIDSNDTGQVLNKIQGVGLALDLTLRELQNQLKENGHPWELAKAFDGACPVSQFFPAKDISRWADLQLELQVDGQCQQLGNVSEMITGIEDLLAYIAQSFTLRAGDIVLTGTPKGVGVLNSGMQLELFLREGEKQLLNFSTSVC